jgi:hypothetical protein
VASNVAFPPIDLFRPVVQSRGLSFGQTVPTSTVISSARSPFITTSTMPPTVQGIPPSATIRPTHRPARQRRPATIAELAERARDTSWDPTLSLKYWLKTAERHRNAGYEHIDKGDLENGFVELARAATIVMEKVPIHKDYQTQLKPELRKNLGSVRVFGLYFTLEPVLLFRTKSLAMFDFYPTRNTNFGSHL